MNFKELISKRRACKLFNDKKINEAELVNFLMIKKSMKRICILS
ncbi:hypothetical protein ACOL3P_000122 [Campylobacter jejuni]